MNPLILFLKNLFSNKNSCLWLLAIAGIAVYINCLPNEMFWDDNDFILNNRFIKDWQFWPMWFTDSILSGTHLVSNYWRPLLQAVFTVEWHLWADWVYGWHATSILMHTAAGAVLFLALDLLLKNRLIACLSALAFIVHPVQTESVVYPNSMGDALANLFVFLGVFFYTRSRQKKSLRDYILSVLMYPLALMSKESGILLVAFLGLAEYLLTEQKSLRLIVWNILCRLWPLILMAAIYIVLRATVLNFSNSFNFYNEANTLATHAEVRFFTFLRIMALYAGFLFTPVVLRVERLIDPATTLFTWDVLWGAFLFLSLLATAAWNWRKRPVVTFGILWFFVGIAPTSNLFVLINALIYEHFLYTGLVGIFIALLWYGHGWVNNARRERIFWIMVLLFFSFFMIRSVWRTFDWRTSIGFYEKLAPTCPKSYRVINNLGMEYANRHIWGKAETTYLKAKAIDPNNAVAYHNLGNLYRDTGRPELAIEHFEKAIALQEDFIFSYKALAQMYLDKGENNKARRVLEKYFGLTDEKVYILNILTEIAYRQKDFEGARNYLTALLKLEPNNAPAMDSLNKLNALMRP